MEYRKLRRILEPLSVAVLAIVLRGVSWSCVASRGVAVYCIIGALYVATMICSEYGRYVRYGCKPYYLHFRGLVTILSILAKAAIYGSVVLAYDLALRLLV